MSYFYIKGRKGLSHSGSFVDNRQKWVNFSKEESIKGKPKTANGFGVFVESSRFKYI